MKKLNNNAIRRLIMETIEEESLGEAKKKEVEEEFADSGTPVATDVAAKSAGITPPSLPIDKIALLKAALEAGADKSSDDMRKAGAALKAEEAMKEIQAFIKSLKGETVNKE